MSTDASLGATLRMRITEAGETIAKAPATPGASDPLASVRRMMTPELIAAMTKAEPRIMAWLRESRANVVQFTTDPIAAMRAALPDLDPRLLAQIVAIRAVAQRVKPDAPGVRIDSFTVDVAPAK